MLVAAAAISKLRALAQTSLEANHRMAQLDAQANRLSALEWQAAAKRGVSPAVDAAVSEARARMSNALAEIRALRDGPGLPSLDDTCRNYVSAIEEELALIRAGRVDEAREVDDERVDPGYRALRSAIENATAASADRARRAQVTADVGSASVLGIASVAIGLLLWRLDRTRQRAQAAVVRDAARRENEERLNALLQRASEVILIVDADSRIQYASPSLGSALSGEGDDWRGAALADRVHPDDVPALREALALVAGDAAAVPSMDLRLRRDGQEYRYTEISLSNHLAHASIRGIVVNCRDATERRRAAEQMQRAAALGAVGQLASGVAHTFNNLLAIILGRAELLERRVQDQEVRRGLGMIGKAAQDGAAVARRLQTFARRRLETAAESVDAAALVRDVVEMTRARWHDDAMARGITYDLVLELAAAPPVAGSASELREAFTNLVSNALEAMPRGGRLTIRSQVDGGLLRISFADTGVGIGNEVRPHLFEPFFTTKGPSGNGLGLAVSHGIVSAHGGSVRVESEPGRGTVFTISLPAASAPARGEAETAAVDGRPLRLLVVDDEQAVREMLTETLQELGHDVVAAGSGREALERLDSSSFDVVFTDLAMPEMNGWSLARAVRERAPATRIVLLTGHGAAIEPAAEEASLADAILAKPAHLEELASVLGRLGSSRV